jgi:outer membrane protein assembly factor BamB
MAADGTLYMPGYSYMIAINRLGSVKWKQNLNSYYNSPAIGFDGTIYAGSQSSTMYALYPSGSVKWTYPTGGYLYSSPTIDLNGIIYIGCADFNLYAFYPSGSIVWTYYMQSAIESSPAVGLNGTIYVGTEAGVLYAVHPSGELYWYTATVYGQFYLSSPVVGSDGSIYIGSYASDHILYAFNPNGSIKWKFVADGMIYTSPAIGPDGSIIFFSSNKNNLYSLTPQGSVKWRYLLGSISEYATPTIGANGMIYIAGDSLYSIYPFGSLQWKILINVYPQTPIISSSGIIYTSSGSTVYAIGTLLSTVSPSSLPWQGLLIESTCPKSRVNNQNTVNKLFDLNTLNI